MSLKSQSLLAKTFRSAYIIVALYFVAACGAGSFEPDAAPDVFVPDNGVALSSFPNGEKLTHELAVLDYQGNLDVAWAAKSTASWLKVTATGTTGDKLTVIADPAGLTANTLYTANVQVTSTDNGYDSKELVTVTLWVGENDLADMGEVEGAYNHLVADPIRPYVYVTAMSNTVSVYNVYTGALVDSFTLDAGTDVATTISRNTISNDGEYLFLHDTANAKLFRVALEDRTVSNIWDSEATVYEYSRPSGYPILLTDGGYALDANTGERFAVELPTMRRTASISSSLFGNRYCVMNTGYSPYTINCLNLEYNKQSHALSILSLGGVPHGTGSSGRDIAVNADGSKAYLVGGAPYGFTVVDIESNVAVVDFLSAAPYGAAVEMSPNDTLIGATNTAYGPDDIWVYDSSDMLTKSGYVSGYAKWMLARGLAISGDGNVILALTNDPKLTFFRSF